VDLDGVPRADVEAAVSRFLSTRTLPTEYRRENKVREYDLRPLVLDLRLDDHRGTQSLLMTLRAEPERTARADQVIASLGLPEGLTIERTALHLEDVPAVLLNYRRAGEAED
jgi:hypothetical protein